MEWGGRLYFCVSEISLLQSSGSCRWTRDTLTEIVMGFFPSSSQEGVIQMIQAIQLPVIAEGVESKEQADFLLNAGCTHAQGYYYAKPMTVSDFEQLLSGKTRNAQLTIARELLFFKSILNLPMIHSAISRGMLKMRNKITNAATHKKRIILHQTYRLYRKERNAALSPSCKLDEKPPLSVLKP